MDSIKDVPMVDEKTGEIANAKPAESIVFSFGKESTKNLVRVRELVKTRSYCNAFASQALLEESLPNLVASFKRFGWTVASEPSPAKTGSWYVGFVAPTCGNGSF